jgi:hypothetical protein
MVTGQMSFLWLMLKRIQIPLVLRMNCERQIKETEKTTCELARESYEVYLVSKTTQANRETNRQSTR